MSYLKEELYALVKEDAFIFDFIQESALDGLWYWDLTNPEEEWMNPRFWKTLGYDPEKMPHKVSAWQDIIFQDDLADVQESVTKHFADPNFPYDTVVRYKHADGRTVWIRCKGMAIRDEAGKPIRMLGAHIDISAEKENEERLKERIARYDHIFKGTDLGTWEWDMISGVSVFNERWANMIGYTLAELGPLTDVTWASLVHADDLKMANEAVRSYLDGNEDIYECEVRMRHKNGSCIWVSVNVRVVSYTHDGRPALMTGSHQDITRRKESEILAAQSEAEIKSLLDDTQGQNERLLSFAHIVSHNLRSHTGNLTMIIDLLKEHAPESTKNEFFPMIEAACGNLSETVKHLSDVVVLNTSTAENLEPLPLRSFVENAITTLKGLEVSFDFSIENKVDSNLHVLAVPAYLDSIVLNLLTNAVKYRSEKRSLSVEVEAEAQDDMAVFKVKDNGLGIDMKYHGAKIFGMFKTFHGNSDARGVGLFLAKSQALSMGGKVEVESELDKGSIFSVYLKHGKN
jgi:PAS domain S-box-containing protein